MLTTKSQIYRRSLSVVFQGQQIILFQNQQVKKVDFEFGDDVWSVIKEYAGIYHIGTEWHKVRKLSAAKLYKWYRESGHCRVSIYGLPGDEAAVKRKRILYGFSQLIPCFEKSRRNEEDMNSLYSLLTNGGWACKDFTKYKVGQTILYDDVKNHNYKLGVIQRVNKASINVNLLEPAGWSSTLQQIIVKARMIRNKTIRVNFKVRDELDDRLESIYLTISKENNLQMLGWSI